MQYDLTFLPREDKYANAYFSELNCEISQKAAFALFPVLTASLINPLLAQVFAGVAFFFLMFQTFKLGKQYRSVLHLFLPKHKGFIKKLLLSSRISLFMLTMSALYFSAVGQLNANIVLGVFSI